MSFIVAYYILLALWLPLAWPVFRLTGGRRLWGLVVVGLGALASAYEAWIVFGWSPGKTAPIRIDALMIAFVLPIVYLTLVPVLGLARKWVSAALLGIVVVGLGSVLAWNWIAASRESARLTRLFDERNALMFKAKFSSPARYDSYFHMAGGSGAGHPVGHWHSRDGNTRFTRLIVNPAGEAWLFWRCGASECHFRTADARLAPVPGAPRQWRVEVVLTGVGSRLLTIRDVETGGIEGDIDGHKVTFDPAPPPLEPSPPADRLHFVGAFGAHSCMRVHARVRQLWLWREEGKIHALGLFEVLLAGQPALFRIPVVMGAAALEAGRARFAWSRGGQAWAAELALSGDRVALAVTRAGKPFADGPLAPAAYFKDDVIDLAPLSGAEDWRRWFDTVLSPGFISGRIPPCPG